MKHSTILLLMLWAVCLSSCTKDFLDVKNTQNLYRESYVKDLSGMQDYVNGIYMLLSSKLEATITTSYAELVSDNIRPLSVTAPTTMIDHYNWTQRAETNYMIFLWQDGYSIIRSCNFVIEEVDKYRDENKVKCDDLKGQALAIRAYVLYRLVNTFAQPYSFTAGGSHIGIPYITTSDITKPYTRQTVGEVYAGMITDLTSAGQLLQATVTDVRFMNRNAAKALLARVYLYKEDYVSAKSIALEVASQVPLLTIPGGYPTDLYKFKSPSSTETLFQLVSRNSPNRSDFFGRYLRRSPIQFVATNDIASILKENPNDIRNTWVTDAAGQWNIVKFPTNATPELTPAISIQENAYYPAIIRSSEMFLTVAEAAAKTGDEKTALDYINAIRKRADQTIPDLTVSGPALLDSIYKERRKELSFEGLRLYDLQRLKQGVSRKDALPGTPASLVYPSDKLISPIPISDVTLAGIIQNKSY